ncbi:hypothetical protein BH09ACT7_BH09ACT7_61420 [soil metagenome]
MRITFITIAPLLAAAAVGAVIATAPVAAAADVGATPTCTYVTSARQCQSPGNVQINASPSLVQFHPYGGLKYLTGDHG